MGGRTVTCPVDVSNHTAQINMRDSLFDDLRGRGYYSSRDGLSNAKNQLVPSEQQQWAAGEKLRSYWRKKGKGNGPIGVLPAQTQVRLWCQSKAKATSAWPGDLVLRKVLGIAKNPAWGKLGPNWKGPYRITSMAGIGAYFLEDLDEHVISCL